MPEIAVAPLPVAPAPSPSAKSPAPESKATSAKSAQGSTEAKGNAEADTGNKDPFAAVLQRMVKNAGGENQGKDGKDAANPLVSLMNTETQATQPTAPADVMAQVLAQMGQLNQDGTPAGKRKGAGKSDDDDKGENAPLAAITPQVMASNLPDQANDKGGSDAVSVAARPAILATEQPVGDGAKNHAHGEEAGDFHALLTAAQTTQQSPAEKLPVANSTPQLPVQTPVGHENWSQEVGDKMVWMAGKQESKAELVLNPPHMGRVEVSITLNGDQANASFVSANPAVRDALEAALPRLREVLADAGVRLDQAQVGADNRGGAAQDQERRDNRGHDKNATGEFVPGLAAVTTSGASSWARRGNGMVDTFV